MTGARGPGHMAVTGEGVQYQYGVGPVRCRLPPGLEREAWLGKLTARFEAKRRFTPEPLATPRRVPLPPGPGDRRQGDP
jgi:hypothetical protein